MNSKEIKREILWYVLYRLHYLAAITEYGGKGASGIADVYGITKSGYTVEFEVKCSKSDLVGELNAIKHFFSKETLFKDAEVKKLNKYWKHRLYNGGGNPIWHSGQLSMRPNQFYFVVTDDLGAFALEQLKDTPYGLYKMEGGGLTKMKKSEYFHKEKPSDEVKMNILRKACVEVETTRTQLLKGLICTGCHKSLSTCCDSCMDKKERRRLDNKKWREENKRCLAEREALVVGITPVA